MRLDLSDSEKTAALLLSGATSYILNQISTMHSELEQYSNLLQEKVKENQELKDRIRILEDSNRTEPALQNK